MLKSAITILSVALLLGCSSKNELPKGVFSKEEITNLIVQLEINQALYKLKFSTNDSLDFDELNERTFTQFNTSQEQFNTSLAYYSKDPKVLEGIYNQVIITLAQKQAELQSTTSKK